MALPRPKWISQPECPPFNPSIVILRLVISLFTDTCAIGNVTVEP